MSDRHKIKADRRGEILLPWKLIYKSFLPSQEKLREALCTLGNGYQGTRGAWPESVAGATHYPGLYVAGLYNKTPTYIAGRIIYNEDLVNCPNWICLKFRVGEGEWISSETIKILSYQQELNFREGVLTRKMRVVDSEGHKTTVETQRIVHMGRPHLAAIRYSIVPENYEGNVLVRSALDGTVKNTGVQRYRQLNCRHLFPISAGPAGANGLYVSSKTSQSKVEIAEVAKIRFFQNRLELFPKSTISIDSNNPVYQDFCLTVKRGSRYEIEKVVSIYTSRDKGVKKPVQSALNETKLPMRFENLLQTHKAAWESLWKKFDVGIEGDQFSQAVIRLHIFHLLQTASPNNASLDAGLPARGLHGEAYRGHVFWDELFVMPLYDLNDPEISKALLMYRYQRLPESRKYAVENKYQGSMVAWQSGSTGEEETQSMHLNPISGKWGPDGSRIQRHVSFAIAHNVWEYWVRSMDLEFMSRFGAEILLSIAQFGSSLTKYNPRDRKYHTEGIMGPDEFHERLPGASKAGFRDNAYTNLLIVWTLMKAQAVLNVIPGKQRSRLLKKLGISQNELKRWNDICHNMSVVISHDGVISQFEGYFRLKELNWNAYRRKYGKIGRMDRILKAEGKSPNDYKLSKQADVLMLFYLLSLREIHELFDQVGFQFKQDILEKNYDYYVRRTSHGSTLSKVVNGYNAHLLGRKKESWDWFMEVLKSDVGDTQGGTTPEGIHCGVMGGSVDMVRRAFAGIHVFEDRIRVNPSLPSNWKRIKINVLYRGRRIMFDISKAEIGIFVDGKKSQKDIVLIEIGNQNISVWPGKKIKVRYRVQKLHG